MHYCSKDTPNVFQNPFIALNIVEIPLDMCPLELISLGIIIAFYGTLCSNFSSETELVS